MEGFFFAGMEADVESGALSEESEGGKRGEAGWSGARQSCGTGWGNSFDRSEDRTLLRFAIPAGMISIRIQKLTKRFGLVTALHDLDLAIEPGELFFLLGPSGCGKTTLLRSLAGFYIPEEGTIFFGADDVTRLAPHKRNTGMMFQSYALWPHMTVAENVAFGLEERKVARDEIKRRVGEALEAVRMGSYAERKPNQLSGGQQQRVALARALVVRPRCLLLDEPLSNLDAKLRLEMRAEITRLHHRLQSTMVYVTHDQLEAMSMADTIAVMNQGIIKQLGSPREIYDRPASMFVADFIGSPSMNFLDIRANLTTGSTVISIDGTSITIPAMREDIAETDLVLGVRPENIVFSDTEGLRGEIFGVEYLGTMQIVTVTTERGVIKARIPSDTKANSGDRVSLKFRPEKLSIFDKASGRALKSSLNEGASHG